MSASPSDREAKIMVVKDIEREDIEFISKILGVEAELLGSGFRWSQTAFVRC